MHPLRQQQTSVYLPQQLMAESNQSKEVVLEPNSEELFERRCKAACIRQIIITKPQLRLLFELAEGNKCVVDYYPPGKGLRNKDLAYYLTADSTVLALTEAGIKLVRDLNQSVARMFPPT